MRSPWGEAQPAWAARGADFQSNIVLTKLYGLPLTIFCGYWPNIEIKHIVLELRQCSIKTAAITGPLECSLIPHAASFSICFTILQCELAVPLSQALHFPGSAVSLQIASALLGKEFHVVLPPGISLPDRLMFTLSYPRKCHFLCETLPHITSQSYCFAAAPQHLALLFLMALTLQCRWLFICLLPSSPTLWTTL